MAITNLDTANKFVAGLNTFQADAGTYASITAAVDATAGASFTMDGADNKYLVLAHNSHATAAKTVTIKAGNGIQGNKDVSVSVDAGEFVTIVLDSGRFKNVSGDNKNKVIITGASADIKVAVFKLP